MAAYTTAPSATTSRACPSCGSGDTASLRSIWEQGTSPAEGAVVGLVGASSRDPAGIRQLAGTLDLLLVTANVPLEWGGLIAALAPNGGIHFVGAMLEPVPVSVFPLIVGQRRVSGSPTGSPVDIATMLDFAARHRVLPQTEHTPMSRINEAFARLEAGRARYRIVLDADF